MVGSLCEAYHWTLDEAMRLTVPQIVMLNHAAYVSHERFDLRYKLEHPENGKPSAPIRKDSPEKPPDFDHMSSEAIAAYVMSAFKE